MTCIVVDASISLAWCFPDKRGPASLVVRERIRSGDRALVPAFWAVEVLNAVLLGERRGRITRKESEAFLDDVRTLDPILDYASLEQIAGPIQAICRDHNLTPYDALYVELAFRSGFPLATLDGPQKKSAEAMGVKCL